MPLTLKYECDNCGDAIEHAKEVTTLQVTGDVTNNAPKTFYLDSECFEQLVEESDTFRAIVLGDDDAE